MPHPLVSCTKIPNVSSTQYKQSKFGHSNDTSQKCTAKFRVKIIRKFQTCVLHLSWVPSEFQNSCQNKNYLTFRSETIIKQDKNAFPNKEMPRERESQKINFTSSLSSYFSYTKMGKVPGNVFLPDGRTLVTFSSQTLSRCRQASESPTLPRSLASADVWSLTSSTLSPASGVSCLVIWQSHVGDSPHVVTLSAQFIRYWRTRKPRTN